MKKKIFITYSSFEEDFVKEFKEALEKTFCCEVFAFQENLRLGDEWFKEIIKRLNESDLHIIILSPFSVRRPWTYFEAGGSQLKEGTKLIPMTLCLSKNEISEYNPLSRVWRGDFFRENNVKKLFEKISEKVKDNKEGEDMEEIKKEFVKDIPRALGDRYKILEGFRKIKDTQKTPNVSLLHKQGIAPVPAILQEAFAEDYKDYKDYLKEKLGVCLDRRLDKDNREESSITDYSPAKPGEMIRCFEDLSRQGFIKRVETPLERFLKKIIKKEEEKVSSPSEIVDALIKDEPIPNFLSFRSILPSEIVDALIKDEPVLKKIEFNNKTLEGLNNYPMIDKNDLIVFLQIKQVIDEILGKCNNATGLSPERIWKSVIDSTINWFKEYKEYYKKFIVPPNINSDPPPEQVYGEFHTFLWKMDYTKKELRDFLRSWYKILV